MRLWVTPPSHVFVTRAFRQQVTPSLTRLQTCRTCRCIGSFCHWIMVHVVKPLHIDSADWFYPIHIQSVFLIQGIDELFRDASAWQHPLHYHASEQPADTGPVFPSGHLIYRVLQFWCRDRTTSPRASSLLSAGLKKKCHAGGWHKRKRASPQTRCSAARCGAAALPMARTAEQVGNPTWCPIGGCVPLSLPCTPSQPFSHGYDIAVLGHHPHAPLPGGSKPNSVAE